MVDALRYVAVVMAVAFAWRARARLAAATCAACAYLYAADLSSALATGRGAVAGVEAGLGAIFLGPSVWPARAAGALPFSGFVGNHRFAMHAVAAALATFAFARLHREASRGRPETIASRRASRAAHPALAVALLEAIGAVLVAVDAMLTR